ncbi:MAG TPA: MgtC/SapB family protein [Gemmatimonadales bacterium]|nr:MgtC/SapB family protein [Gemmatimonadales bacterium]
MQDAETLQLAARLGIAGLVGLAVGVEREWSGHARGPTAHFAGLRTFLILGLTGGIAGLLSTTDQVIPATVLLLGAVAFVVAAFAVRMRRPEAEMDGTTEAAALVVLGLSLLAGLGQMALAGGAVAIVVLALGEKQRLHALVAKVDEEELHAAARFAVMALVILPLLPSTGIPWLGNTSLRGIWAIVLLFSGINFAGYVARKVLGAGRGYGVTGALGGIVSSTLVTLQFARQSRVEPQHGAALATGVTAACSVLAIRVWVITAVLASSVAVQVLPYVIPPVLVGGLVILASLRHTPKAEGGFQGNGSPLGLANSIRMTAFFVVALVGLDWLQAQFGQQGVYASAVLLGLTDMDALLVSMSRLAADGVEPAAVSARAIAIGTLSNTAFKLGLALIIGRGVFRTRAAVGLLALGAAIGAALVLR